LPDSSFASVLSYALPNVKKENILEEGLQRRDGELDLLHSMPDCVTFPLTVDVFEESILILAEKG
jgi:hypothetical protein